MRYMSSQTHAQGCIQYRAMVYGMLASTSKNKWGKGVRRSQAGQWNAWQLHKIQSQGRLSHLTVQYSDCNHVGLFCYTHIPANSN